jgi:cytochrome b561
MSDTMAPQQHVYSRVARTFHWATVAFILVQFPTGIIMAQRAGQNIFDSLTNTLYDIHKLVGFLLLWLVASRLAYRLIHGAPRDEPTIQPWQSLVSHTVHWSLYVLLIVVPVLGWFGVSLFPALSIAGLFSLPALTTPDQEAAKSVFFAHKTLAIIMGLLILTHIGAALFHHLVRKDNVLRRMLPSSRRAAHQAGTASRSS